MDLFQKVLDALQKKINNSSDHLIAVTDIISKESGVDIPTNTISIKNGVIRITVAPTLKMGILIKKDSILLKCKEKGIPVYSIA